MNKKILSVLLAVLMVACLCFALIQVSATEGGTTYTYEVGEGKTYANVRAAMLQAKADHTYEPGDKIKIVVTGEVWADGENKAYNSLFSDGAQGTYWAIQDTEGGRVPVTIKGSTENAADTVITFYTGTTETGTQCRRFARHPFFFEDLTFAASGSGAYLAMAAMNGELHFDNVVFDNSGFATPSSSTALDKYGKHNGFVVDGGYLNNAIVATGSPTLVAAKVSFKNGNYTNIKVTAVGSQDTGTALNATGEITTKFGSCAGTSIELTIGEGATMGTVNGIGSHVVTYDSVTVNVEKGATVGSFSGTFPASTCKLNGDLNLNFKGGTFSNKVYAAQSGTINGSLNINFGAEGAVPAESAWPNVKQDVYVAKYATTVSEQVNLNVYYAKFVRHLVMGVENSNNVMTIGTADPAEGTDAVNVNIYGGTFAYPVHTGYKSTMHGDLNVGIYGGTFSYSSADSPYWGVKGQNATYKTTVNGDFNLTIDSNAAGTAAPTWTGRRIIPLGDNAHITGDLNVNFGHELAEGEKQPAVLPSVKGITGDGATVGGGVTTNVYYGNFTSDMNFGNDSKGTDVNDSTHGVGFITTNIYGGTFEASVAAQRGQGTDEGFIRGDLTTNIHGGTFKKQVSVGGDDNAKCKDIVVNIYGGTFNDNLVLVGKTLEVRGKVDAAIYGGTFKNIYATADYAPAATNPAPKTITLTLEPREQITINGTLAKYGPSAVGLTGGVPTINVQKNTEGEETEDLRFGKDASLTVDTIEEGMTLRLYTGGTGSAVVDGKVYVTVLNGEGMGKETLELFSNRNDEFGRLKAVVEGGVYKVVGCGLTPSGAQLVLNDRVGIRVLYSVDEVEEFRAYGFEREFFASFRYGGSTFQSVPYDELKNNVWVDDEGVEYYYVDVITSMGPAAFDLNINTGGFGVIPTNFHLDKDGEGLLYNAKTAWEKAGMTEWVEVAKALINMGEVANGKTPSQGVVAPEATDAAVEIVSNTGAITGYGLYITDAVGIKVEVADAANAKITVAAPGAYPTVLGETNCKVNGNEVIFFVSAQNLDVDYTITATCGDKETTIVASVETIANVYVVKGVETNVANALLIYANALSATK